MKWVSKKENALCNALMGMDLPFDAPLKDLIILFLKGYLNVTDAKTGKPFNPSDFDWLKAKYGELSREKQAEYLMALPRKSQDQESDTCKLYHLLRRASQLRNELSEINKRLTETYGIALLDEFLSLHNESHTSRILHSDNKKICRFYNQNGMKLDEQGNPSPFLREELEYPYCRDVMGQL